MPLSSLPDGMSGHAVAVADDRAAARRLDLMAAADEERSDASYCAGLRHAPGVPSSPKLSSPRAIQSRDLMGNQRMIVIRHGGESYRLQLTRAGKLILTK
ncbi:MAG: hemin uptake protein HemP [Acetobacteraceae bacterium]